MFYDEMTAIDRGMAIDSPFARQARANGSARKGNWLRQKHEYDLANPLGNSPGLGESIGAVLVRKKSEK